MKRPRRHEFDAAVKKPVIASLDERCDPLSGLLFGSKGLVGIIMPVIHCSPQ
jgi:hypothetical protein